MGHHIKVSKSFHINKPRQSAGLILFTCNQRVSSSYYLSASQRSESNRWCLASLESVQLDSCTFLFIDVNRCTLGECDAVGSIEGFEINPIEADASLHGDDRTEKFTVLARIERRYRQFIPAFLRLPIDDGRVTDLPDEIIGGLNTKPNLQHIADAITLILTSEEAPRALQLPPELHETILIILNRNHNYPLSISRELPLVLLRLHVSAAHLVKDNVPAILPTSQRALTITTLALLLTHLVILLFGKLVGQQLQ